MNGALIHATWLELNRLMLCLSHVQCHSTSRQTTHPQTISTFIMFIFFRHVLWQDSCPDRNKYVCFSLELLVKTQRYALHSVAIDAVLPLLSLRIFKLLLCIFDYLRLFIHFDRLKYVVMICICRRHSKKNVTKCERLFMLMYTCIVYVCRCHGWSPVQPYHAQCILCTHAHTHSPHKMIEGIHTWGSYASKLLANQALHRLLAHKNGIRCGLLLQARFASVARKL